MKTAVLLCAWIAIGTGFLMAQTATNPASSVRLEAQKTPSQVDVSWTSKSLTPTAPYVHYEYQVQLSSNLVFWENAGALIPGGFLGAATIPRTFALPNTNLLRFARLNYRLNMPGANLSGMDLRGADLRGANLAGANLSGTQLDGALLGGANLTGANLSGASLDGANLQDVNLNGFDLSTIDLGAILGTPLLTQVTANPSGKASELVPNLPYNGNLSGLVASDANVPGIVSTRNAMLMLKTNTTVGELNALLASHGASIVASSPKDVTLPNAVMMVRLPSTNAQQLLDLTVALSADARVEAAAPDLWMSLDIITSDLGSAAGWKWDIGGAANGGNWGLEFARVPQMWNVLGGLQQAGAPHVWTGVIDGYFINTHLDVNFSSMFGPAVPAPTDPVDLDHGMHVSGIIGAAFDNGRGIDGVNPQAGLISYTTQTLSSDEPNSGSLLDLFEPGRQASAYRMVQDIRNLLISAPHTQIINLSLGYNWYKLTNAVRPAVTDPFTSGQLQNIQFMAEKYGKLMLEVANASPSVLIVCSAGNSSDLVHANHNSPMATAALVFGAPNIVVVEAHDITGSHTWFSNLGGHVAAPGEDILSANGSGGYVSYPGTSMAAPFVSGVAGFLMAVDSALEPGDVLSLLQKNGQNVDAFTSLMEIDRLPGRNFKVQRLLLDIDDSSEDGSLRVAVPRAALDDDRSFQRITGANYNDLNHVIGDGVVDMSDFRRWRDWLLFGLGNNDLNGTANHLKFDANGDFRIDALRESTYHPRGDFNGDGKLDPTEVYPVPGTYFNQALSDVGVMAFSDVWDDPAYPDPLVLFDLLYSVDFHVSATNFFYKNTDIDQEVEVSVFDAGTGHPVEDGGTWSFGPGSPDRIFTVPTGAKYFVASQPIEVGDGTNVQMRSITDFTPTSGNRGADYAIDLAYWEMTAVADLVNPRLRDIDSEALAAEVDAYIPAGSTGPIGQGVDSYGARAWATNSGTFYAVARSGTLDIPPTNVNFATTYSSAVRWQRSFIKNSALEDPTFLVKPMRLELAGFGPGATELNALAEISVEMRSYDVSPDWEPVFSYTAEIRGKAATGGNPATFDIIRQDGDLPDKPLQSDDYAATYKQQKYKGEIDLDDVPNGHSFEVRYRLYAEILGAPGENASLAYIGDPLDYGSGIRMEYGTFGELPRITSVAVNPQGNGVVSFYSHTNFYYRLYRGEDADTTGTPIAMKLGISGPDQLVDPAPLPGATPDDYTLENQPVTQPLDLDGDGIDDVYELLRPSILDPLNGNDAFLDSDGDGRSNLTEYQEGTNPEVPDAPTTPRLNFPGVLVPTYPGGELIDLNNDGVLDAANGLSTAIGNPDQTFRPSTNSTAVGIRSFIADTVYLRLDGDAFPDIVAIDQLTNRVYVLRGLGDGRFESTTNYASGGDPRQIIVGNVNGDALPDVAVLSMNGRSVDLHVSNGDGTLTRLATVTTNAYGTARGFALGDFNNDQRDDVVIGYAANAVVFLSTNGTHAPGVAYPVGSSPESIALADLNHDGRLDIVTANRSSDDLSVLLGTATGFAPQVRYPVGDLPLGLRLQDLNGDTFADVILSLASAEYQQGLLNQGNGTFATPYPVPAASTLSEIVDWNGDGKLDLLSFIDAGGLVSLGNGNGTFDTRLQIVPTNALPSEVRPIDFNGDGRLELAGLNTALNAIDVWEHAAVSGTNRLLASVNVGQWIDGFVHGDFNGDGLLDLAATTHTNSFGIRGTNQVIVFTNQGNFVFQRSASVPLDVRPEDIVAGDFDGDGDQDLSVHIGGGTLNGGSRIVALLGNGAGGFTTGASLSVGTTLAFVDSVNANADDRSELVLRGSRISGATTTEFLEVYGLGVGGWAVLQTLPATNNIASSQVASVNGDAFPDLVATVIGSFGQADSFVAYPGGAAGFGSAEVVNDVPFQFFSRVADLNADGRLDVVVGNTLFLRKTDGSFYSGQPFWIGASGAEHVADFNGDGKADLQAGLSVLLQK